MAIFLAILSAKEVLPMAGRPAIITKSDACQPAVILSKSWKPLGTPVKLPLLFAALRSN